MNNDFRLVGMISEGRGEAYQGARDSLLIQISGRRINILVLKVITIKENRAFGNNNHNLDSRKIE